MNNICHAKMRDHIIKDPFLPLPEMSEYGYWRYQRREGNYRLSGDAVRELSHLKQFLLDRSAFALLKDGRYNIALIRLAMYREHWKNDLQGWKRKTNRAEGQFASLLLHLIDRYKVPAFMKKGWTLQDDYAARWYLYLASGGSVRKLPGLPFPLSKKAAHLVRQVPEDLSVMHGLLWAQVKSLGGHSSLFRAIAGSFIGEQAYLEKFWLDAIAWLIRQPDRDDDQVGPMLDYIRHRQEDRNANFSLRGRTWSSVSRDMNGWHRDLHRNRIQEEQDWRYYVGNKKYVSLGKGVREKNKALIRKPVESYISNVGVLKGHRKCMITITQVLNDKQLREEGAEMRHCVYSYRASCENGVLSIWSMRAWNPESNKEKRLLTIELRHASRRIVQVRGLHNQRPSPAEMAILQEWAKCEGLGISSYI